jgi:hypothetical protein|tara:strand:+ start:92 stop:1507 length:1416 start_codon:yes stop_codon:yes gene_type:complete
MTIESINLDSLDSNISEPIKLGDSKEPSSTFGIELLMNDKVKKNDDTNNKLETDINLEDLSTLEEELNNLSSENPKVSIKEARSNLFSGDKKVSEIHVVDDKVKIQNNQNQNNVPTLKFDIPESNEKTWDGMSRFNDIPIQPDKDINTKPQLSKEELLREKFKYLRKLEDLESKGVTLSKKYNMESSLLEMQGEYETLIAEKEKKNACKFQGRMLMAAITGLEFLNNKFDPFDLHLDGWGEQINENIDDYDEIFAELHEKYKSKATMAPELKLLFQLGGSAIMIHMTNTMFKSAMPGMDDIMRQNPELMQQFTQAAVNQMGQASPGLGGFMNNVMNPDTTSNSGPPPPPVRTQGSNSIPPSARRPDIGFSRGPEDGINISQQSAPANPVQKSSRNPVIDSFTNKREEMKGPSDISNLLSGLKTKHIPEINENVKESSTISISELKELSNTTLPKKSKRRARSDKNTVSLDI